MLFIDVIITEIINYIYIICYIYIYVLEELCVLCNWFVEDPGVTVVIFSQSCLHLNPSYLLTFSPLVYSYLSLMTFHLF